MRYFLRRFWVAPLCALVVQGCLSDDGAQCVAETAAQQAPVIDTYVTDNNLTVQTTASGLRYSINSPGAGDNATFGDTLEVQYTGKLLNGTIFDQGTLGPFELGAVGLISGFEEGLTLMNEGAEATLILPSILAYQCNPPPGSIIGQNTILVFDVTMLSIDP